MQLSVDSSIRNVMYIERTDQYIVNYNGRHLL